MGLYNFHVRFVPLVLDGRKTHTIRAIRRHPDRPGSTMYLYTGLRQKGARLLLRARCVQVQSIRISANCQVSIDGVKLARDERNALAVSDGFSDFAEMMKFWDGRRPFVGKILHWEKP